MSTITLRNHHSSPVLAVFTPMHGGQPATVVVPAGADVRAVVPSDVLFTFGPGGGARAHYFLGRVPVLTGIRDGALISFGPADSRGYVGFAFDATGGDAYASLRSTVHPNAGPSVAMNAHPNALPNPRKSMIYG